MNAALPAIVGGLASTAQQPGGASSIQQLLGSHGGILGSLGSLIGAGGAADGGILGQVLGRHEADVNQGVQQASGLDSDRTRKLLMILAPIVIGALAKRAMSHGAAQSDPNQLNDVLRQDAAQAQEQANAQGQQHVGGLLGQDAGHGVCAGASESLTAAVHYARGVRGPAGPSPDGARRAFVGAALDSRWGQSRL